MNLDHGFTPLARRAALDLAGLLGLAAKRRFADQELSIRGANAGLRIAELLAQEVR